MKIKLTAILPWALYNAFHQYILGTITQGENQNTLDLPPTPVAAVPQSVIHNHDKKAQDLNRLH